MNKRKKQSSAVKDREISYKNKTLHYRYADIRNYDGDATLADMLNKALSSLSLVKERYQIVNEDTHDPEEEDYNKSLLFINNKAISWNIVFGDLMRYSEGANKSIVTVDDNAQHLEVATIAPPESLEGKRREFLDSILYFGSYKNHVAVIQSAVLRTSELERHINWLLHQSKVLEKEAYVLLTTKIPVLAQKKLEESDTKTLKIGAPLIDSVNDKPIVDLQKTYSETKDYDAKKVSVKPKGLGLSWLLNAFGDMSKLAEFGITEELLSEDAIKGSSINVALEISYTRKASKSSQTILNSVSTAMRHSHPDDISIDYGKVGRLVGRELVLHKKLTLRYIDGVLDALDLYPKIREWLIEQITVEELEAE
ncbi:hypothetical protein [Shewanella sp. KCT]|uniref:hypothetical protein n=1 Tax=Shewanella sp. KCT TaxID=2569535 RepID=UPI001183E1C4|nr:hypothetical protein [Shewanella sp. KCT]TVP11767.1 hypothetical protein AYI87_15160 [Shewanella sp. KCT]